MHDRTSLLIYLIAGAIIIVAGFLGQFLRRLSLRRSNGDTDPDDSSAILSYYITGHQLIDSGKGSVAGMRYRTYVTGDTSGPNDASFVAESAFLYTLDLPFNTQAHLLGLSKDYGLNRIAFEGFLRSEGLQKVTLEGDFPDHFDIYAASGQDVQVRTVLDPASMAFVEEYCHSHFWEIHDSTLYFAVTNTDRDDGTLLQDSARFVQSIRPALLPGMPGAAPVHHDVAYGEYDGPALDCPLCQTTMELQDDSWFLCPNGHGALLSGRQLEALGDGTLTISADASKAKQHGGLTCPHCQHAMEQVHYNGGKLVTNHCDNCGFNWLDADEIAALDTQKHAEDSDIESTF